MLCIACVESLRRVGVEVARLDGGDGGDGCGVYQKKKLI